MMNNQSRGIIEYQLGGRKVRLCYDWSAIEALVEVLGKDFDSQITRASLEFDTPVLAKALAVGLEKYQSGEFGPEDIMELSPPVIPTVTAIQQALTVAFHGTLEVPESRDGNPLKRLGRSLSRILVHWLNRPSTPATDMV